MRALHPCDEIRACVSRVKRVEIRNRLANIGETPVGVFGERVDWSRVLEDGDRVELYRGLIADPREQRRKRAEKQGAA